MFQIERLEKIKQILTEQKSADVIWLSSYLKVSEVTIRRDLEKLESEGFLKRTYGGAILNNDTASSSQTGQIQHMQSAVKPVLISDSARDLGEICLTLVEDYDVIFLGRGESNRALAERLYERTGVVVFTNSLMVLQIMEHDRKYKVILTGGEVDYVKKVMSNSSIGIPFPDIRVNKAFLHIQGADLEYGLTVNEQEDAWIYREIKSKSRNMVVIMEGKVFDKIGLIKVDDICGGDYVVTDSSIPEDYKRCFYKNGIRLHQKFDL